METEDRWLDPAAAAAVLGTTRACLAKWRCCGSGPPFTRLAGRGSAIRYSLRDLHDWLRKRRVLPVGASPSRGPSPEDLRAAG